MRQRRRRARLSGEGARDGAHDAKSGPRDREEAEKPAAKPRDRAMSRAGLEPQPDELIQEIIDSLDRHLELSRAGLIGEIARIIVEKRGIVGSAGP